MQIRYMQMHVLFKLSQRKTGGLFCLGMRIHTCIHIMVFIYEGSCTTCVKGTVAPLRNENEIAWNAFPDKRVLAVT